MNDSVLLLGRVIPTTLNQEATHESISISIPRCRHSSRITSPTRLRSSPYRFLFRYFGMITTWYLQYVLQRIM